MRWLKVGAVVFFSVVITALGIDAADTLNGSRTTLLGQLVAIDSAACPDGMVEVPAAPTLKCVDQFEASAHPNCPHKNPVNQVQSQDNINDHDCGAVSQADVSPWRFIDRAQAQTACLRSGKRLITAAEWFLVAAGTPDTTACNINSASAKVAGAMESCRSATDVYDTIGNVWEWTSDDVIDGLHKGQVVPAAGYVAQVDGDGFPTVTEGRAVDTFAQDYFWSASEGAYGVLRGGFYGSQEDAGLYSVQAETLPTAAGGAIGFRCVI